MRTSHVGSLIANLRYNLNRQASRVRIFEIAPVFLRDATVEEGALTVAGYAQPKRISFLAYGSALPEQWGQARAQVDYFDVKADLEALFAPVSLRFEKTAHPALHPGRSARVLCGGREIGWIGELHPRWQQAYSLPFAPVICEVDAAAAQERPMPHYRELSKFPVVARDMAFVVAQQISAQAVMDTLLQTIAATPAYAIVQRVVLFDEYRGKGLQEGEKSLAFRFTLQDTQNTLLDDAIESVMTALASSVEQQHTARMRA